MNKRGKVNLIATSSSVTSSRCIMYPRFCLLVHVCHCTLLHVMNRMYMTRPNPFWAHHNHTKLLRQTKDRLIYNILKKKKVLT